MIISPLNQIGSYGMYFNHSSKVSYKNEFSDTIENITEKNSDTVSKTNKKSGGLLLFGFGDDTDYANIYRDENYSANNPIYVVEGIADGKKYKTYVNVNDVNPKNASRVEMGILHTHLSLNGEIPNGLSSFNCSRYDKNQSIYDKKDYLSYIKWLTDCQFSSNNMIMYSILKTQYEAYSKYC